MRVALIFIIAKNTRKTPGSRARDGADVKKTSKRLQSGAFFGDNAVFKSRSRRDRSRCGGNDPKWFNIKQSETFSFWLFLRSSFPWCPKTIKTRGVLVYFKKNVFFAPKFQTTSRPRKYSQLRLDCESGAHVFTFELKVARYSRQYRFLKIVATLARELNFNVFGLKFWK